MQKIENTLKSKKHELEKVEQKNSAEEKELIGKKNTESQLLINIIQEYDSDQQEKNKEFMKLKKESELIKNKFRILDDKMRSLRMEKECKMTLDIEWKRKKTIMRLETEEQVSAIQFLVNFWKIQNMKKRKKKKRRKRKKKNNN